MPLKYTKERILGQGSFGTVFLIRIKNFKNSLKTESGRENDDVAETDSRYVLKDICIRDEKQREAARQECHLLSQLNHSNIIRYFDSFESPVTGNLCLVMEYCPGGDVAAVIRHRRGVPFNERQVVLWFQQLASALNYLHQRKILHRDIKTGNIFVTADSSVVKLGDFGVAKVLEQTGQMARTCVGTPGYFSPEICGRRQYNSKSDIWSLGCVLYQMMTLRPPFTGRNMNQLLCAILRGQFPPMPVRYSYELRQTVATMLKKNPDERPSAEALLKKRLFSFKHLTQQEVPSIPKRKLNTPTANRKGLGTLAVYAAPLLRPVKTIKNKSQMIRKDKNKKDHYPRRRWKPPTQTLIGALSSLCLTETSTVTISNKPSRWSLGRLDSICDDSDESLRSDEFERFNDQQSATKTSETPFHRLERWLVSLEAVHGVQRLQNGWFLIFRF